MDIIMPEMAGDEVMNCLNSAGVKTPVLILSLNQDDSKILKLFRQGVRGYLYKNCTASMMNDAIQSILQFGFYHNELLKFALTTTEPSKKKSQRDLILENLTPREKEFLKLVCHEEEYTYDQIASIMVVQHRTIDAYREGLFRKYGIKSKTGLVLFVLKHNLLCDI
jgi:DNA-binding NarL/FixJ family response regulator